MEFNRKTGENMKMSAAKRWMEAYVASEKERTGNADPVRAHDFGADRVNELLSQPGAQGLRICPALDPKGNPHMILIAVNDQGKEMTAQALADPESKSSQLLQYGSTCPPRC